MLFGRLELQHRRCVSREECVNYWHIKDPTKSELEEAEQNHTYVVFADKCVKSCPAGYDTNLNQTDCEPCPGGKCDKSCQGGIINSIEDAYKFRGCTYIMSSIGIHIRHEFTQTVRQELEECLGSIERINGYLKIARSTITDLKFLKSLHAIDGNDTTEKYALFVVDNQNIQELWDWSTKKPNFTIKAGRLFFHYNPKLCLQKIYSFLEICGYKTTNSDFEIGKGSNGDKIPCNITKNSISVNFTSFNVIRVRIPHVEEESRAPFRYVVYYTKDTFKNITMFEDLDPCSDNGWKTVDKSDLHADELVTLTDLEPDTQYVCYFTSYSENSIGARSEMLYVSTLPTKPSELAHVEASSNSSSEIYLQWEPPTHIHGKLREYVVTWYELPDDDSLLSLRDYCKDPMDYSMISRTREVKVPQTTNTSIDCGCFHSFLPKEGFKQLCRYYDTLEFPISYIEKSKSTSCESYFSSYVQESPFRHGSHESHRSPKVNRLGPNALFRADDKTRLLSNSPHLNRKTQEIGKLIISANTSEIVLSGLKHFSTYAVTVKACRESSPQEMDTSEENRCSKPDILITRTLKNNFADNIISLNYTVNKQTLSIFWEPPRKPNGLLLAFELELKRNKYDSEMNIECISFSNKKLSYLGILNHSITNIPIGNHEFRIRAVTLSGKGLFTRFHSFEVLNDVAYSTQELLFLILLILLFLSVIAVMSRCLTKQTYKAIDNRLVAEVNPNYHYAPDPAYEVLRENITFGDEIGAGTFGKVFEGVLSPGNKRCAIKTMIEDASKEMENDFLREACLMKSLNSACFIVKLLGVVSRDSPPLVLMELMDFGDLKNYLRSTRVTQPLGNAMMIKMAVEIADAMTFMESHKFVHRDLAARNCMVGEDLTVKVGDFGMARDIYETDYYRKTDQELLPIRWMAPESLRDGEFTSLTDVWSYGVVLWEIASRAEQPYQGLSNDQVLNDVIAGATLTEPPRCPGPLAAVMVRCWKHNPLSRPNFMQIMLSLSYYHKHDDHFRRLAYFYTPEAERLRDPKYVEMQSVEEPLLTAVDP